MNEKKFASERVEVVLIPGEIKRDFSLWQFIRKNLKLLAILLMVGVVVGAGSAALYFFSPAPTPTTSASDDTEATKYSALTAEEAAFLSSRLAGQGIGNLEIAYRIDEEIAHTEYLFKKLLIAYEQDRSVLPYKVQQLQLMLDDAETLLNHVRHEIPMHPALLANDSAEAIEALIQENELVIESYREALALGDVDIAHIAVHVTDTPPGAWKSDDPVYAYMLIHAKELEAVNAQLEKMTRGEAPPPVKTTEASAVQSSVDRVMSSVDYVKGTLLDIVPERTAAASSAPAPPSMLMAMAIFLAVAVGILGIGLVALLIRDSIHGENPKQNTGGDRT